MEISVFEKRSFYFVSHICQHPVTISSEEHSPPPKLGNSERSCRQPGCKDQTNESTPLTSLKPSPRCVNTVLFQQFPGHRSVWEDTESSSESCRASPSWPGGLEWSWERTAKLLLPTSALRGARGSCHRPCGWGIDPKLSNHQVDQ